MIAHDDAREVLAAHLDFGGGCDECSVLELAVAWPCPPVRLARTLLALTGEQAVAAGTVALQDASGGEWDDGIAEDVVRSVLAAALAAAEEAS